MEEEGKINNCGLVLFPLQRSTVGKFLIRLIRSHDSITSKGSGCGFLTQSF